PLRAGTAVPERAGEVSDVHGDHIADHAVVDALHRLALAEVVAVAEAGTNAEVPFLGEAGGGDNRTGSRGIDGDRLLAEDVFAGLDGGPEVNRPEAGRRAQQHDIDAAAEQLLVAVEAVEAAFRRHIDLGCDVLDVLQFGKASFEAIHEGVAHGDEFDVGVGAEGLLGGAGAAAAAADQADAEQVAAGG